MTGVVVDHKETGIRYAISEKNFNPDIHKRVRDLKPGETVLSFQPVARKTIGDVAPVVLPNPDEGYSAETPETEERK